MVDKMVIRRAQHNDLNAMAGLLEELFGIEDDFAIDVEKQIRGLYLLLKAPNAFLYVAKYKNRVIGMISMQQMISTAMGGYVGLIEDLIVSSDFRSRGVGRLLLEAIITKSVQLGYSRLALGADERNHTAIAFYRTFGFEMSNMGLMYHMR
ncbi:MAG TPA: GNAT family N-acetyltransferase [Sulfuricurvum sp.]|nr:GNAT family N-acetyltransferase [Sulfuricurvum sp.]